MIPAPFLMVAKSFSMLVNGEFTSPESTPVPVATLPHCAAIEVPGVPTIGLPADMMRL
jgi:hypothetical protein